MPRKEEFHGWLAPDSADIYCPCMSASSLSSLSHSLASTCNPADATIVISSTDHHDDAEPIASSTSWASASALVMDNMSRKLMILPPRARSLYTVERLVGCLLTSPFCLTYWRLLPDRWYTASPPWHSAQWHRDIDRIE